ncbi:hypothetical protein SAMN05421874_12882 [Nonomuraea maritima]|uniref:Uncharacterized protein n=1 Tax=Nonomuraea maritima TaxID=683260 RepID=A0A1G9ML57_9ACTN|nr:hypothetical protein [Nonomuraea maritima]SDL74864.1 hypothetical protein SAMN05421874_12882 [Nonomuraea maritima]
MKLLPTPSDDEITDMLHAIRAPHPSDPVIQPARRLVWRDQTNPAEKALTLFDRWVYERERED